MNNFISAFYEAVYLYALALNETLEAGLDPRNGTAITSKMWNRSFPGIFLYLTVNRPSNFFKLRSVVLVAEYFLKSR